MRELTMGSLFDGIGGFPLAAIRSGITPVWASEIEAFPIEVTKQRFPSMIHVGDITKLNGAVLPPVDIICGGSPCQDLSVAGARAGLAGARSGLFMEQVRLVKEMRNADKLRGRTALDVRPRFMVWENVPGAFSSGERKGEDFRIIFFNSFDGRYGIYINVTHLCMDAAAVFVFFSDLLAVYDHLKNGKPMPRPLGEYKKTIRKELAIVAYYYNFNE